MCYDSDEYRVRTGSFKHTHTHTQSQLSGHQPSPLTVYRYCNVCQRSPFHFDYGLVCTTAELHGWSQHDWLTDWRVRTDWLPLHLSLFPCLIDVYYPITLMVLHFPFAFWRTNSCIISIADLICFYWHVFLFSFSDNFFFTILAFVFLLSDIFPPLLTYFLSSTFVSSETYFSLACMAPFFVARVPPMLFCPCMQRRSPSSPLLPPFTSLAITTHAFSPSCVPSCNRLNLIASTHARAESTVPVSGCLERNEGPSRLFVEMYMFLLTPFVYTQVDNIYFISLSPCTRLTA